MKKLSFIISILTFGLTFASINVQSIALAIVCGLLSAIYFAAFCTIKD